MLHIATVTMENGVQNVPQALMGARATVDTADAAHVQLDVAAGDVAGYVRQGDDLVIHLRNGEVIVLSDYFDDGDQNVPSLETLNGAGDYVPVDFGTSAAVEGVLTPSIGVAAGAAAAAGAAGALGGLGMAGVAGLGALAVGGVVAVAGGSGGGSGNNNGGGTGAHVAAPEVGQYGSDTVSGTGTPGDTVTVTNQTTGEVIGTGTVDPDGKWSVTLDPRPNDGDQVSVSEKDPDGNTSGTTDVTVGARRPEAPEITQYGPDTISGTGTPGDTVTVTDETTGQVLGSTTVGSDGKWSVTPDPKPGDGDQVSVTGSDANGNDSQSSGVTIGTNRPETPQITQYGPDTISGTGTPGDTVTVTDETTGQVLGSTTVGSDGKWSVTPDPKPGTGDQVSVTGSDASGNDSQSSGVTIGENRPAAPEVTQSTPDAISGTGTPGDTITVTDETTGQVIGQTTVDPDGKWSVAPDPKPGTGDQVSVVETDTNGNDSQSSGVTVVNSSGGDSGTDTTAPGAPTDLVLDAGSDSGSSDSDRITKDTTPTVKGSAEAGATVTVYDTDGTTVLGTAVAGDDGSWSVTTSTLNEGQHSLTAKAADAAGNVSTASGPLAVTIDTTAPAAAQVATANASTVSGTVAEASATITIDYTGDGEADATAAADGDGKWSFDGLTLADGTEVKVWAADAAGNISEVATRTVDGTKPVARIAKQNATFTQKIINGDTESANAAVMADLDGDNHLDIYVSEFSHNPLWTNNDGEGNFTNNKTIPDDTGVSRGVAIADVDGDDDLDIYVLTDGQNRLWLNNGSGTFTSADDVDSWDGQGIVMGDVTGDGHPDIYVLTDGQNLLWINDGTGKFTEKREINGDTGDTEGAVMADIDGDGDLDIYAVNDTSTKYGQPYGQNHLWLNDGSGHFPENRDIQGDTGRGQGAVIGDFDGDGDADIYVSNYNEQNYFWENNGSEQFSVKHIIQNDLGLSHQPVMGDVDGDGDLDIYVPNFNNGLNRLWINNGEWNFTSKDIPTDFRDSYGAAMDDVNGDGYPDIYVANYVSQNILWLSDDHKIAAGDSVDVGSSEKGTVYLVNDQVTVNSLEDITNAADNLWNAVQITDETQSFALDTTGLAHGNNATYHAYAVDLGGNLSLMSEMNLIIT
ncbi:Ig-like domain-containing protein [Pelagibacterium halotolerans]|uniref:Ig-like domain-containing protein n=1 Tax=Pelagibacterium halotolerans TaxID=531813 RepID=UPI00384BCD34